MTALQPRTREAVLQIAAWQLGVLESPAGSNAVKYNEAFYGRSVAGSAYPWCLTFVWWVFREAGFSLARTASCSELRRRYQAAGQWVTEGYRPGDILLLTKPIGTGILATAMKAGLQSEESYKLLHEAMKQMI